MSKPTIVLVHGAFGDASSWRGVFDLLDGDEYTLLAAALPLRGVASDVAYLGAVIDQLDGPVVLVGHSYAGCVITVAGASDKVAALVYVAGIRARRGRVDRRPAGPLPVARDGELPPAAAAARRERRAVGRPRPLPEHLLRRRARRRRRVHGARAASARGHGVRGAGRRCRLAHEAVLGRVRNRRPADRSRSCTASRTTGPARR